MGGGVQSKISTPNGKMERNVVLWMLSYRDCKQDKPDALDTQIFFALFMTN